MQKRRAPCAGCFDEALRSALARGSGRSQQILRGPLAHHYGQDRLYGSFGRRGEDKFFGRCARYGLLTFVIVGIVTCSRDEWIVVQAICSVWISHNMLPGLFVLDGDGWLCVTSRRQVNQLTESTYEHEASWFIFACHAARAPDHVSLPSELNIMPSTTSVSPPRALWQVCCQGRPSVQSPRRSMHADIRGRREENERTQHSMNGRNAGTFRFA